MDGFHVDTGFTNRNMMRADVANTILAKGQQNIILTDSSKFGRIHPGAIGPISNVQRVITDTHIPRDAELWLQAQGIELDKVSR